MSQHWHGHWTNEAFKPVRLQNWEVPNWHPCWPDRHCRVTRFIADNRGRILVGQKKSTKSPWGHFKSTWELPTKISRQVAYELSAPPQYKINAWAQHKKANKQACIMGNTKTFSNKQKETRAHNPSDDIHEKVVQLELSQESESELPVQSPRIAETIPNTSCSIHLVCQT